MSSNSLYPVYYNDIRNKINSDETNPDYDKYARINNNYMNTIIIPGYKKNKTDETIEFPLIELNYKKTQKFFNTDILYNIIPYNTEHYIVSKNNNNKQQYVRLEYNNGKLINEFSNIVSELYKNYIYIVEIKDTTTTFSYDETVDYIVKIEPNVYSIIVNNIPSSLREINFGVVNNIIILDKKENNLFISVGNDNIYENIGLITNNTTFKIVKKVGNHINPYYITSLNSENNSLRFDCIILKADNMKDTYYILSYSKTKYNIPELRVHFWTNDNNRMIENNYYSIINGYSIKSNIRKENFLFTIKNYKYNKLLKNVNKDNKFLKDTTIYSFNKQYQQLIPLSNQTFKLNKLKSNNEYYITIDIKIKDNSYVYYLCVNNDIIGKNYSDLKNNKNDFILLKKKIDISQEYPYEDLYKTDNVNIPRIFNINTANKEKISYLLDDNLRWIFYKNNDDINKSRFYNKVLNKYITEKDIKEYIILNLLSSDNDLL